MYSSNVLDAAQSMGLSPSYVQSRIDIYGESLIYVPPENETQAFGEWRFTGGTPTAIWAQRLGYTLDDVNKLAAQPAGGGLSRWDVIVRTQEEKQSDAETHDNRTTLKGVAALGAAFVGGAALGGFSTATSAETAAVGVGEATAIPATIEPIASIPSAIQPSLIAPAVSEASAIPTVAATSSAATPSLLTTIATKVGASVIATQLASIVRPANAGPSGTLAKENQMPGGLASYIYAPSSLDYSPDGEGLSSGPSTLMGLLSSPIALGLTILVIAGIFLARR